MEVEVKLRLASQEDHAAFAALLPPPRAVYRQENVQFDGQDGEISAARCMLRLRFFDDRCMATYKGRATLVDGIGRAEEVEAAVDDVAAARAVVTDPSRMAALSHLAPVQRALDAHAPAQFQCLGAYTTVHDWEGHTLELDHTQYSFGETWEIEVETDDPQPVRDALEALLRTHGIAWTRSARSKYANFRMGAIA